MGGGDPRGSMGGVGPIGDGDSMGGVDPISGGDPMCGGKPRGGKQVKMRIGLAIARLALAAPDTPMFGSWGWRRPVLHEIIRCGDAIVATPWAPATLTAPGTPTAPTSNGLRRYHVLRQVAGVHPPRSAGPAARTRRSTTS